MRFLLLIILFFWGFQSFGNSAFDRGVKAYEEKKFETAILIFDSIYSETPNDVSVCFNLAKSYESNGNMGKAMLFYERCLVLSPYDSEALESAEKISIDLTKTERVSNSSPVDKALLSISPNLWAIFSIVLALFIGLLIFLIAKGKAPHKKRLYVGLALLGLLFLGGTIFSASSTQAHFQNEAIGYVTLPNTPTYTETGSMTSVTIPEASRITILENLEDELVKVQSNDGQIMVLKQSDFEIL